MDMIEILLWGYGAALFILVLAGGVGGKWTTHRDKHHKRPHETDGPPPLDFDDWER